MSGFGSAGIVYDSNTLFVVFAYDAFQKRNRGLVKGSDMTWRD